MKKFARKFISLSILIAVFGIITMNFIHVVHSHEAHHKLQNQDNCPFMNHKEALCPMSVSAHISALRSVFETVLPNITHLSFFATLILLFVALPPRIKPFRKRSVQVLLSWLTLVSYKFSRRLLQSLFARGILNPKLF